MENIENDMEAEGSPIVFEDCSSGTDRHVTPSHSRSASGSRDCGQRADYEIVEFNDSNGQYFVMKQRTPPDSSSTANMNGVSENGESPHVTILPSSTEPLSPSLTGASADDKLKTNPSSKLSPQPHIESRQWLKSPSPPDLSVTNHSLQSGGTRPSSGNSTPIHAGTHQNNRLSPSSASYNNEGTSFMLPVDEMSVEPGKVSKQGSKKKKRSPSWYNVLSPSYKQKNEAFHKIFKDLPESEQLMADYTCALMKDILVQGRMYASQNYVCFHSNILKWQTAMVISLYNIEKISKEKTVKLFPNAIQFRVKNRDKALTFTSFTQRDRAHLQLSKLWQNAHKEKPLLGHEIIALLRNGNNINPFPSDDETTKMESPTEENRTNSKKTRHKTIASPSHQSDVVNGGMRRESSEESKLSSFDSSDVEDLSDDVEQEDNSSNGPKLGHNTTGASTHAKDDLRRLYLNREFSVPADFLFKTVFDPECEFWKDYLVGKGSYDVVIGGWDEGGDDNEGNQVKKLSYNLALTNPLGPKSSKVEEIQILHKESISGCCYAVDCIARTLGVPYADYFTTNMRYCIRRLTESTSELRITAEVDYRKTPWGLVKNFIDKNVHGGMEENFQLLEQELDKYFSLETAGLFFVAPVDQHKSELRNRKRHRRKKGGLDAAASTSQSAQLGRACKDETLISAAPSTGSVALPCNDVSNVYAYNMTRVGQSETRSGKLFIIFALIMLFSLLWSNYQMYQRLDRLEHLQSHTSGTGKAPIVEVPIGKSCKGLFGESRVLCRITERVNNLELLIRKHVTTSDTWWRHMTEEWKGLRGEINAVMRRLEGEGTT